VTFCSGGCEADVVQYVRDCLEYLRIGGHLDNGRRFRRSNLTEYKHIFTEDPATAPKPRYLDPPNLARLMLGPIADEKVSPQSLVTERKEHSLSREPLKLPTPLQASENLYKPSSPCDPKHPRIFHMFWAGPFTDKPYMAVMSFLFTQNLGLHLTDEEWNQKTSVCRPQFWVWINPGPAAAVPNPSARKDMYESLAVNPWSAPFLHAKFAEVVKFKMWNTTEQLDGIPELREHWRSMPIFNSGGNTYGAPQAQATPPPEPLKFEERDIDADGHSNATQTAGEERTLLDSEGVVIVEKKKDVEESAPTPAPVMKKNKGGLFEKVGSTSESDYDRLSVILSDMARFILTYRYGGIYLDADTMFLRDWEELWNWHGQFAYRWSFHQKYNTAVLKLHKGSALGSFLFKTALENGLDFHPMTVSRYLKDADLDRLLFRIPDALFDPAWINFEKYQRDRPPFPYFPE
jgi:WD repeat and SOF domain-containing protein 1